MPVSSLSKEGKRGAIALDRERLQVWGRSLQVGMWEASHGDRAGWNSLGGNAAMMITEVHRISKKEGLEGLPSYPGLVEPLCPLLMGLTVILVLHRH